MKTQALTDVQLIELLQSRVGEATAYADSKLSREREKANLHYDAELPKPLHAGNSKYISQDVWDSVEAMKATLLETFSGNLKPVQFSPMGDEDVDLARIATDYCSYVVFGQNNGFAVFHDVIHDALLNRNGIVKVWWERSEDTVDEILEGVPYEALSLLLYDPAITVDEDSLEVDEAGLIHGALTRTVDTSQIRLEAVPPEEFGISPRAKSIQHAELVYHRTQKTITDLLNEGYDHDLIDQIKDQAPEEDIDDAPEIQARFHAMDDGGVSHQEHQKAHKRVMVYEVYTRIDMEGSGLAKLWKITYVRNVILDKEEVSQNPFIDFAPLRRPHSFWGSSFASKLFSTQNAKTTLTRSIIDHTVITTNPRYQVVKGGLVSPKELMENRIGGIVNVTRPDAILPLTQATLNPFIFQTIAMLDEDKEETTGISKLSQGLNKDAISQQNSADMVNTLVSISQQRQKIIARNFAELFLKPLFLEVYRLVIENEKHEKIIAVSGSWVNISPREWIERKDVTVEFALGYGEKEKEVQKYLQANQMLATDPYLSPLYPLEKRYNTLRRALEGFGIKDVNNHLLNPREIPPQQPDPMQQLQAQLAQKQLEIQERQQNLAEQKFEFEMRKSQAVQALEEEKMGIDHALKMEEFQHKAAMDAAELAIVQSNQNTRAVVSV